MWKASRSSKSLVGGPNVFIQIYVYIYIYLFIFLIYLFISYIQVVPGRAWGGSFRRKNYILYSEERNGVQNVRKATDQRLAQYYPVLQSTTPVLLCTTKNYPVLQSTTPILLQYYSALLQFYSVLQRTIYSSCTPYYKVLLQYTLYYKVLHQHYSVLQRTTPVLLCSTKYNSSTTLYYKEAPMIDP